MKRLVPLPDPINPVSVWEHTPADYFGSGEYPRFLRPVGPRLGDHPTRWETESHLQRGSISGDVHENCTGPKSVHTDCTQEPK